MKHQKKVKKNTILRMVQIIDYELDEEDEENYKNKQIGLITDLLKKEYGKYTPVEISREDGSLKFNFAISNITENLKNVQF